MSVSFMIIPSFRSGGSKRMVSFRLLKPQYKSVGFATMLEHAFSARVLGVPQHIPFFNQNKPCVGYFFDLHGFVDAVQTLSELSATPLLGVVVHDPVHPAGLERS